MYRDVGLRHMQTLSGMLGINVQTSCRALTRIAGPDELAGGLERGAYFVCGTGDKSAFCMQFLYKGITVYDENGIYVSLDRPPSQIRETLLGGGCDVWTLQQKGRLLVLDVSVRKIRFRRTTSSSFSISRPTTPHQLVQDLSDHVRRIDARRVVIDPLDAVGLLAHDEQELKGNVLKLISTLKLYGCTSLLVVHEEQEHNYLKGHLLGRLKVIDMTPKNEVVELLGFHEASTWGKDMEKSMTVMSPMST